MERTARAVNEIITRHADSIGLDHADGKIEFGVRLDSSLMLVDAVGTPDENRFLFDGFHISKQVMRDFYARLGLQATVRAWADAALPRGQWSLPPPLPAAHLAAVAAMYHSVCELWTGERVWGAPPLGEVVRRLRAL